ncbi:unnamed protein product [Alopecurus aequalis]
MAGQKRPAFLPAAAASSPSRKKLFRPASAPCLPALSASTKKLAPRPTPPSSSAAAARPRPPAPSASRTATAPKKPAAQRPDAEAAQSVHPARRLACGTAVIVRTRLPLVPGRLCLLIWLPARVVSSSDAYHCTVKYAADLHPIFAAKIIRVPAADVRPHRSSAPAKPDHARRPQAPP